MRRRELDSVNTLLVRDGRVEGPLHRRRDPRRTACRARRRSSARGGAARRSGQRYRDARVFSRRGEWPPDVADADLVVNATSERDEVLVEPAEGQTLIDLPYPETATGRAARARQAQP